MHCLSIHQPWAHAILHLGKDIENRTWSTKYRGPLLIHASKSLASYKRELSYDWMARYGVALPSLDEMAFGAILGVVDLTDCINTPVQSVWAENAWKWVLKNPVLCEKPIPLRGQQGLFSVDREILLK